MYELHLWVENQVETGSDATGSYLAAADWSAPSGITLHGQQLAGDDVDAVWDAYRTLAAAVAAAGHGDACADGELGPPTLTACPAGLRHDGYTSAAESLARLASRS